MQIVTPKVSPEWELPLQKRDYATWEAVSMLYVQKTAKELQPHAVIGRTGSQDH